uniref:AF4/FMR2 family, member 3 n=2 Tax=Astyanax mexicanus TaxID=7994 RepID=A0A3B1K7J9_ASTMX
MFSGANQVKQEHFLSAQNILGNMTHSWPSQQPPGGGGTERFLYSDSKEGKRHSSQHKHVRDNASFRMPRVAPHKSMLADDLKLSSDEDDGDKGHQQISSWADHHNLSGQRTHTHGGRARHSSSGSSGSDSSSESESSSQRSLSPSPREHSQPGAASQAQPGTCSKEDPSFTHWQLNTWLEKVQRNRHSVDHDLGGGQSSSVTFDSGRGPSPGRYWERDSNPVARQDRSPSQSPVPSPRFDYSPRHSPRSSPGYSPCPSPGNSPVPSPVPSVCPSPGASLRGSRSPSPLPPHPPKSPSPTVVSAPAPQRLNSYPQGSTHHQESPRRPTQPTHTSSPVRQPKVRPWVPPDHNTERITDSRLSALQHHHSKHKETPHRPKTQSIDSRIKSRSSPVPNSDPQHHSQASSKPHHSPKPKARQLSSTDPNTERSHSHRPGDPRSKFNQNSNSKPKHSPASKSKHLVPSESSSGSFHSSSSRPPPRPDPQTSARPNSKPNSRRSPSPKPNPKSREAPAPNARPSQKEHKRREREQEGHGHGKAQGGPQAQAAEAQRQGRLAEEQLIRRRWVRSSEDEEEEDEERSRRRREGEERERKRRRRKEPNAEWKAVQPKQRPHTNSQHHQQSERSNGQEREEQRTKKTRSSVADPSRTSETSPDEGQQRRRKHKLYTLVPFGRTEKSTAYSHRGLRNLVVKIDLSLLARVPSASEVSQRRSSSSSSSSLPAKTKEKASMRHLYQQEQEPGDARCKRKAENGEAQRDSKRSHFHTDKPPAPSHSASGEHQESRSSSKQNGHHEDYFYTKRPLSPLSPPSAVKTQHADQQTTHPQRDSTVKKSQMPRAQPKIEAECTGAPGNMQPPSGSWVPSTNQPAYYRGTVPYTDVSHHAEYYMHEAKRLKHRADAMVDKLGKAVNYVDAALSFMECGKAMEEGPLEAKSPYTMYAETVELIRYAMRLKSHTGPGARQEDKQLAVLCFRCLALLYWQMFRLKKDNALKYSKALLDYFKSSPKVPHTGPTWNDATKGIVPPTCKSPVGLIGSQPGSSPPSPFINIPHRIHQMAANHLNITNSVLYSYEYWEVADTLAKENKEFFNYLNTLTGPLTLHSSMAHIVQYTRQGLQWIRISANLS